MLYAVSGMTLLLHKKLCRGRGRVCVEKSYISGYVGGVIRVYSCKADVCKHEVVGGCIDYFNTKFMEVQTILQALEKLGTEQTRKIFRNHGAPARMYGVKVGDLKALQKQWKLKHDHALSLALYDTGNSDAMYLAGLISDPKRMSKDELRNWAENASWYMLSEYTVAWTASESLYGCELAKEWMDAPEEHVQAAGWSTYSSVLSILPDEELDKAELRRLLERVGKEVHGAANRVRYTMNGFVIAVGSFVPGLLADARRVAQQIGVVAVEMGGTACKVPLATAYIEKVVDMGRVGKKKKTAFC